MTETVYNGWTNHATWMVALHLGNTEYLHADMVNLATATDDEQRGYGEFSYTRERVHILADAIKDYVEEFTFSDTDTSRNDALSLFRLDLITSALAPVNWEEIAQHYADDYPYEADDDDDDE
jgi:hypothetical protein